jgi:hypothetical protein
MAAAAGSGATNDANQGAANNGALGKLLHIFLPLRV